jgi:hypothetical protein
MTLEGELRICDPYFGSGSLIRLHELVGRPIRFLTSKVESTDKAGGVFADRLSEFKVEHPTLEVRKNAGRELHDRYILSEDSLVLLGHGLKDIGKRDSFVVRLGKDQVGDVISDLAAAFDDKWAKAELVA